MAAEELLSKVQARSQLVQQLSCRHQGRTRADLAAQLSRAHPAAYNCCTTCTEAASPSAQVSTTLLKETQAGKKIKKLTTHCEPAIATAACQLVAAWRQVVKLEQLQTPAPAGMVLVQLLSRQLCSEAGSHALPRAGSGSLLQSQESTETPDVQSAKRQRLATPAGVNGSVLHSRLSSGLMLRFCRRDGQRLTGCALPPYQMAQPMACWATQHTCLWRAECQASAVLPCGRP